MLAPLDDPVMADFVNNLDRINALAEASPGFIWRLKEGDDATTIRMYDDDWLIVNMSVWDNVESLKNFTYETAHVEIFRRRKEWFSKMDEPHMVLWHVAPGHEPSVSEAEDRLNHLRKHGDTASAFTFKTANSYT